MTHISSLGRPIAASEPLLENDPFIIIQNSLDQDDTKQAIKYLLFVLADTQNIPDLVKAYGYISQLLPHMEQSDVRAFIPIARKLCQVSSHLHQEQKLLALQLTDWYEALASNHFSVFSQKIPLYREALYYFAKAIQISTHSDHHERASELLMQALFRGRLNNLADHLDLAKRSGDTKKFEDLIHQIEPLELLSHSPYWGKQTLKLINTLYNGIIDPFLAGSEESRERFQICFSPIQKGIARTQHNLLVNTALEEYPTEKYLQALQLFRQTFNQIALENNVSTKEITLALRTLINVFLSDLFTIMGPPPCGYDLRAMGSAGREEMCRFSDLEVMILIEKEECLSYFKLLFDLLNLQICSLGESEASESQIIFTCANAKNLSGLHLDIGDNCIKTPTALANLQRIPQGDPATFEHMALFSVSLSSNTEDLFKQYSDALRGIFKEVSKDQIALGKAQALRFIKARVDDYLQLKYLEDVKDLKKNYAQPLNLLLADIALYWDIPYSNTQEIINALQEREVFVPESCKILREFSTAIYKIRNKLHTHYQKQKEEAYVTGCATEDRYILLPEEKRLLESSECLIIKPLYSLLMQSFQRKSLKEQNQDFTALFSQVDLVKTALKNLLAEKNPINAALKKLSMHVNNNHHIHAALKAILQEKQCISLKLYEEFGLSVAQAVDLTLSAWDLKKTIFLVCENKSIQLNRRDLQSAQFEVLSANSAFYIQLLLKLSLLPLTQKQPLYSVPYQDGSNQEIQIRLGKELKALLTPFNPITVAQWADNVHLPNLSSELSDMLESLSLMSLGKEFEYSKEALLTLAEQLINNKEGFLQYLQNSVFS
ncbi:DUF294 nucleotidyltransferase-like domain-containing protein [Rhabdochlamydiaceae symbiont of Dictyostelium giganteum]|uniref:DUF294 nucleotidyltransferase-like domain-containing protein n=1 Tax=Rhabdochlamydiaceae symbiont of Dictyostelium giganteum TaxID=3342349 RepID=UPI0038511CD0